MFYYRVISTDEVLGAAHSVAQDADWIARYVENLGEPAIDPDDVECFESETDPRGADPRKEPAPEVTPEPDVNGFKLAVLTTLTVPVSVAQPLSGYITLATDALNSGNWTVARQIIDAALTAEALTEAQHTTITGLLDDYHIPES